MTNKIVDDYARYLGRTASSNFASGPFISGNSGVGNVLSVSNGPFLAPTYQWRKNGVNISGATSQTYTQTINDQGNVIDAVVSGFASVNQIAVPLQLVEMAIAYGGSAFTGNTATTNKRIKNRIPMILEYAGKGTARLPFINAFFTNQVAGAGNGAAVTLRQVAVETSSGFIPITFGGNPGFVVPGGPGITWSDPFPFTSTLSTEVYVRLSADAFGGWAGYSSTLDIINDGSQQYYIYDPATPGNWDDVYGVGFMSQPTGATTASRPFGPPNIVMGVPSTQVSELGGIDSIAAGTGDYQGFLQFGWGAYQRRSAFAQNRPYTAMSISGRTLAQHAAPASLALMNSLASFHSYVSCDGGTNDISAGSTAAQVLALSQTIWSNASANLVAAKKVNQMLILPFTTDTTDKWTSLAAQTASGAYAPGGVKDQFNTSVIANVGSNGLSFYVDTPSVVADPGTPSKWKLRTFATTLAAAYVSGNSVSLAATPGSFVGELLVSDPAGPQQSTGVGLSSTTAGTGPFTVGITAPLGVAQNNGNTVKAAPTAEGLHPTAAVYADMAVVQSAAFTANPPS